MFAKLKSFVEQDKKVGSLSLILSLLTLSLILSLTLSLILSLSLIVSLSQVGRQDDCDKLALDFMKAEDKEAFAATAKAELDKVRPETGRIRGGELEEN